MAMVGLKISYLAALFESFDVREKGSLVLAKADGTMLLRRPYDERFLGKSMANAAIYRDHASRKESGKAVIVSSQDGVERINYFQHVPGYPLFVVAALASDEVLADWNRNMAFMCSIAAAAVSVIILLAWRLQSLLRFREQAGIRIDEANRALAISNQKLARQVLLDGMTGIANRHALDDETGKAIQLAARANAPLGLIMFDVDHFKRFNDLYGHIQGDYCLKDISGVLARMQRRPGDLAARYGGEEFALLLPNTDLHGCHKVAQDVLAEISALNIPHKGNETGHVTVSAGVTSFVPSASSSVEEIYAQADAGLYIAKNQGRNNVGDVRIPSWGEGERTA